MFWKTRRQEQARAVPDPGRRGGAAQPRQRAGRERHAGRPRRREDPRPAQGPAQVAGGRRCPAPAQHACRRRCARPTALSLMRFASLGSGSEGNGLVVEAGTTRILIDCGFGVRDAATRLARLGIEPAIARRDPRHPRACRPRRRRARVRRAARHSGMADVRHADRRRRPLRRHAARVRLRQPRALRRSATLEVLPFPVPHDAREPVQFVVGDGAQRARRADRPRHVDAARRGEPDAAATRSCSNATTTSRCCEAATIRGR